MPAGYGVGDHRVFIVDFQERSLIGEAPFQIKRFTTRQLNTKVSSGATKKIYQGWRMVWIIIIS
jgi:hypothetical protein